MDDILYRSGLPDIKETEANRLAADILMPWGIIEGRLKVYKNLDMESRIQKIADDLGASTTAMEIRLGKVGA